MNLRLKVAVCIVSNRSIAVYLLNILTIIILLPPSSSHIQISEYFTSSRGSTLSKLFGSATVFDFYEGSSRGSTRSKVFGRAKVVGFSKGSVVSTILLNFSSPCVGKEDVASFLTKSIAADSNNTLGIVLRTSEGTLFSTTYWHIHLSIWNVRHKLSQCYK